MINYFKGSRRVPMNNTSGVESTNKFIKQAAPSHPRKETWLVSARGDCSASEMREQFYISLAISQRQKLKKQEGSKDLKYIYFFFRWLCSLHHTCLSDNLILCVRLKGHLHKMKLCKPWGQMQCLQWITEKEMAAHLSSATLNMQWSVGSWISKSNEKCLISLITTVMFCAPA